MNVRLQQFLAAENITQAQFADSINVARAGVNHIISGRNKPGYDFIVNTMKRYPELSVEWLLTGKGKMYKGAAEVNPKMYAPKDSPAENPSDDETGFNDGLNLFSQENDISIPEYDAHRNIEIPDSSEIREQMTQTAEKQRKATKIIVFYDDNTFQEF